MTTPTAGGRTRPAGRRRAGVVALLLAPLLAFTSGTGSPAHAAPLLLVPAAAAALPFSVVSAGVGGGAFVISTGGALASAGITAAAALAGPWAVSAGFSWAANVAANFGDPPATGTSWYGTTTRTISTNTGTAQVTVEHGAFDQPGPYDVRRNADGSFVTSYSACSTAFVCGIRTSGFINGVRLRVYAAGATDPDSRYTGDSGTPHKIFAQPGDFGVVKNWNNEGPGGTTAVTDHWGRFELGPGSAAPAPTGPVGSSPVTVTPRTCWRLLDNSTGCTNGTPVTATRSGGGGTLTWPETPAGGVVTSRSAPIVGSTGTPLGDGLTGTGSSPWTPPAVPARFPDCSTASCVMTLTQTEPSGQSQTCGPSNRCLAYGQVVKSFPQVGEGAATGSRIGPDGNSYQCRYGPYPVAVAECQVIPGVGGAAAGVEPANCMGGIGWNPTTWVTTPVKCSMEWAFKPSAAPLAQAQVTATNLGNAAPFSYVKGTVTWVSGLSAGSECFSLDVTTQQGPLRVLSTCQPGPFEAWLVSNRALLTAAMYAAFFVPMAWWAWRQYAPGSQGVA